MATTADTEEPSFRNLFGSQDEYKRKVIEDIFKAFPERKFVLVGDSSEQDPEIYRDLAREHPKQVVRVFIRDVTGKGANADHYREVFRDIPREVWKVFRTPDEIQELL